MCACVFVCVYAPVRAEPVLARIKEDRKRIILPSIDNIKHDTFEVERYENSGHGYNWELWCMYINPPKQWWDEGDTSAPIRQANAGGCMRKWWLTGEGSRCAEVQGRFKLLWFGSPKMHLQRQCLHTHGAEYQRVLTQISIQKALSKLQKKHPAGLALCLTAFYKKNMKIQHAVWLSSEV